MIKKRPTQLDAALMTGRPITIQHHESSAAAMVAAQYFTLFAVIVLSLPIGYWIALSLIYNAGYHNPQRVFAEGVGFVFNIVFLFGLVAAFTWLIKVVILAVINQQHANKMELLDKQIELEQIRLRNVTAPPAGATRLNDKDQTFVKLLQLVMAEAYNHGGPWKPNEPLPWSRRSCETWFDATVKPYSPLAGQPAYGLPDKVSNFLQGHWVIAGSELNLKKYADMQDFNALIERVFHLPVSLNNRHSPPPSGRV